MTSNNSPPILPPSKAIPCQIKPYQTPAPGPRYLPGIKHQWLCGLLIPAAGLTVTDYGPNNKLLLDKAPPGGVGRYILMAVISNFLSKRRLRFDLLRLNGVLKERKPSNEMGYYPGTNGWPYRRGHTGPPLSALERRNQNHLGKGWSCSHLFPDQNLLCLDDAKSPAAEAVL